MYKQKDFKKCMIRYTVLSVGVLWLSVKALGNKHYEYSRKEKTIHPYRCPLWMFGCSKASQHWLFPVQKERISCLEEEYRISVVNTVLYWGHIFSGKFINKSLMELNRRLGQMTEYTVRPVLRLSKFHLGDKHSYGGNVNHSIVENLQT